MCVCVFVQAHVYSSSGLGLGRDNEIITLIKPLQTERSSLFCSLSLPPLCLLVFAAPLCASALVSQADSQTDSSCHSEAAAGARDAEARAANPAAVEHVERFADSRFQRRSPRGKAPVLGRARGDAVSETGRDTCLCFFLFFGDV